MQKEIEMGEKVNVGYILYTAKEASTATEERLNAIFTKNLESIAFYIRKGIEDGKYECECPYPQYEDVVKAVRGLGYNASMVTNNYGEKKLHISWRCA